MKTVSGVKKVNTLETEEFESELGDVAVTDSHVERDPEGPEDWEEVSEGYHEKPLVEPVHFSGIENLDCFLGDDYPSVLVKTAEGWKRIFFKEEETAEKCYNLLKYRWQCYRQIYA